MKKYQMPLVEVALLSSSMDQMQTGGGSPTITPEPMPDNPPHPAPRAL